MMYTDDVLFISGPDYDSTAQHLAHNLKLLVSWINFNSLTNNFQKSEFMLFTNRSQLHVPGIPTSRSVADGVSIDRIKSYTYLGIQLDPDSRLLLMM